MPLARQAQEQAARLAEQAAERAAAGADRRRVDDRQQLLEVAARAARRTASRWCPAGRAGRRSARGRWRTRGTPARRRDTCSSMRGDARRQQAVQAEGVALLLGEGGALVETGIGEQLVAGQARRNVQAAFDGLGQGRLAPGNGAAGDTCVGRRRRVRPPQLRRVSSGIGDQNAAAKSLAPCESASRCMVDPISAMRLATTPVRRAIGLRQ